MLSVWIIKNIILLDTEMEKFKDQNNWTELAATENDNRFEFVHLSETDPGNDGRRCSACTKNINMKYSVSWEFMDFCDVKCLSKYQKCLSSKCSNCSANIEEAAYGKYYQRLRNCFIIFCSKHCILKYRSSVRICSFCEVVKPENNAFDWLIKKLELSSISDDLPFCSLSCYITFLELTKCQKSETTHKGPCTVCGKNEPLEIILNLKGMETIFCGKKCLIAYTVSHLNLSTEECSVCRKYYSSNVLDENKVFHKNSKMYFCSSTCRHVFTLLNNEVKTCDWCQIDCNYISMVKKCSQEVLPTVQFCSVSCLQKYESTTATLRKCSVKLNKLLLNKDDIFASEPSRATCGKMGVLINNGIIDMSTDTLTKKPQNHPSSGIFIPIPVPIYIPVPMVMYSIPTPYPLPFPIPIPVPIFLPIPRNTMKGVTKEIEKYNNKMLIDPCQSEILLMADALIENEKTNNSDSESEPIVDVEEMKETAIVKNDVENNFDFEWALSDALTDIKIIAEENREKLQGRKRKKSTEINEECKTIKYEENSIGVNGIDYSKDENYMRLDYSLGINAWKQWVSKHNTMQSMTFKSEILKMSPEEFSVALCYFVQELRKPNGDEYAPDTIYYLCLGIQYYLDQNSRYDNIFNDLIYDKFTDYLDALAIQFCALYDDESHFIVTRVEEEHLWETKQLGCYSPHVLLNTLIYFNTKYYCRSNVDEHLQLSFYHILRGGKTLKSTMLRYYPLAKNSRKRRVYEMFENNENPLRCPVRLYEYYLSKCPEGAKNKYDTMYLMPEKHCTSESPVWYSSESLPRRYLAKIVNRVKMVKEINVALLSFDN
ncbi:unnamed protein product [Phaedon cochleariae]|uniref:TRASH domain-containing protein n=1 Tax=Phaedon cochleariae TaxID=80249 RepID=A0A9N9SDH9_PHACE|nr:unnamed protein product [Phaedon cochleariae]